MIAFVSSVVSRIRHAWPIGKQSDRQQWRRDMEAELRKAQIAREQSEDHLRRLSIQGRIAGDYRPEGGNTR